jgi:uncharacterized protein
MTEAELINSPEAIQSRLAKGSTPRYGPMLMLFARPALLLLFNRLFLLFLMQLKVPTADVEVRNWSSVYGTLVDFGCLGLLIWLTKREGIRLRDLIGFVKSKLKTDIPLGLGIFVIVFPVTIIGLGRLAMLAAYGTLNPVFPEFTFIRTLPLLAVLYSRILWWPLWSVTEEMTYDGYALPRLNAITKSPWLSVALVSFFYSIQHCFLSIAGFQYAFYSFLLFIPLTIALELIYLRIHRLTPLIIGHWLMDLASVLFLLQIR